MHFKTTMLLWCDCEELGTEMVYQSHNATEHKLVCPKCKRTIAITELKTRIIL